MRPMFISFAFFIIISVLATPIDLSRGNAVALRRRSPNERDKAVAKCKLATPDKLIESLKSVDTKKSLLEKDGKIEFTWVYPLIAKIDDENLILKVIRPSRKDWQEKWIEEEARGLYNVGQLRGWARTHDGEFYYIWMKRMGNPLQDTPLAKNPQLVMKLREEASIFYCTKYHLCHTDHDVTDGNNWVYREVDGKWQAELVDWANYSIAEGWEKSIEDPPAPFVIDDYPFVHPTQHKAKSE